MYKTKVFVTNAKCMNIIANDMNNAVEDSRIDVHLMFSKRTVSCILNVLLVIKITTG